MEEGWRVGKRRGREVDWIGLDWIGLSGVT